MGKPEKKVLINGEYLTFAEISKKYNISLSLIKGRYYSHHKRGEDLVKPTSLIKTEVNGELLTLAEIAKKYKLKRRNIDNRYAKGDRGLDLVRKPKRIYHTGLTDKNGNEITDLSKLSRLYHIKYKTLSGRYESGDRKEKLIRTAYRSHQQPTDVYDSNLKELSTTEVAQLSELSISTITHRRQNGYRGDSLLRKPRKGVSARW